MPGFRRPQHVLVLLVLAVLLVSLSALPMSLGAAQESRRPNVVVILTDDQGWGDLSLHDNPNLSTPSIDALAAAGAEVEHFYVCAVCSPTRAEFLTGRYHTRMGVHSTSTGGERFNADEQTIAEFFRDAGYATAAYGKWHSGMQYPYHPNARGFDDYYGFCSGHWGNYFSPMLEHNGEIVQGSGFLVDDLTNHAIDFIDQHKDQPFFVYLPLNTPHSPMQVPDQYWQKFENKSLVPDPAEANARKQNDVHTRAALAMCENIDTNVGRLIEHLETTGLAEDTIVVYFSDNGPNGWRFNGGLRGRKGSTFEGGLRSPCLIRYPRSIRGGTKVDKIAGAIDLLPTLADFAGIDVDARLPLDGRSIAPLLRGEQVNWSPRLLFSAWNMKFSVRSEQFRMHADGSLYDIQNDPGESRDVRGDYPDVAERLRTALNEWIQETNPASSRDKETRPITLGHPDARWTQMPARDAQPVGNVQRSNRFPNCTYMTHWKSTSDKIVWDVEVLAEGEFEVQMYYACPSDSVGSKIELSLGDQSLGDQSLGDQRLGDQRLGDQRLEATIDEANPSPTLGAQHDRFERAEGYVKDWRAMTLGTIGLRPGKAKLTLRAIEIPGAEVADMRLLMFRRVGAAR